MRQFQVTGVVYADGECPCLGGPCDDDCECDCDCDCDCAEYPTSRCDCGRNDPDEKECDVVVELNVPFGAGSQWIQETAEGKAEAELWLLDPDNREWEFAPFDPPTVEEIGQEPLDVFLWRVGAQPLPCFADMAGG